jgi:hypothetical protein
MRWHLDQVLRVVLAALALQLQHNLLGGLGLIMITFGTVALEPSHILQSMLLAHLVLALGLLGLFFSNTQESSYHCIKKKSCKIQHAHHPHNTTRI